jgi:sulfite reductase (NADPH) hemoprotein beta-component
MYVYDQVDQQIVNERVEQFRDQMKRYLAGDITEAQFLPLRLQNGIYIERLAPLLRIAVPYGTLSATQLRKLAQVSRDYDKGYGHISTRQNIQMHWPKLEETPEMLAELATVQMHAIQTSGSCIRGITSDQFAGAAADEIEDPRTWAEIIRQWSSFHPEFAFLPRKFKIAVCASKEDRAAILVHDIGVELVENDAGETGFRIHVGGGLGRTPYVGSAIAEFLPKQHLLTYLDAIMRVYNQFGRRDNKYKARIKILVKAMGVDAFREAVEAEWAHIKDGPSTLTEEEIQRVRVFFKSPDYEVLNDDEAESALQAQADNNPEFANWLKRNTRDHQAPGYKIITLSFKMTGYSPGDITAEQMEVVADLADNYSFGEARTTHEQNLTLNYVKKSDLYTVWEIAKANDMATPNVGYLTDMICCPGGDFCALANAKSIPIAEAIQRRFDDLDYLYDLGEIDLNISGCMNACGHHHVGHIGIIGVDKKGEEFYQIQLGGNQQKDASLGKILGPSFAADEVPDVMATILDTYVESRVEGESFLETYRRIGLKAFKERVYAA